MTFGNREHISASEIGMHDDEFKHRLVYSTETDTDLGYIDLRYKNDPFPFYYLDFMRVNPEVRGQGHGTELIEDLNKFLRVMNKAGILYDLISDNSPAKGLYEKHGWQKLESGGEKFQGWYVYGRPVNVDDFAIKRAIRSISKSIHNEGRRMPPQTA